MSWSREGWIDPQAAAQLPSWLDVVAERTVVLACASNTLVKGIMSLVLGGAALALVVLGVVFAMINLAVVGWLQPLGLGALIGYAGIAAGMQNSNYFVTTAAGRYVLTLFERAQLGELGAGQVSPG